MIPLEFIQDYLTDNEQGMRNLVTWFLNLVMQIEALQQAGADPYERTNTRKAHRNGYKDRSLKTRYGEINLRKPQFREFPFETKLFGKYARVEKRRILSAGGFNKEDPEYRLSSGYRAAIAFKRIPDLKGT